MSTLFLFLIGCFLNLQGIKLIASNRFIALSLYTSLLTLITILDKRLPSRKVVPFQIVGPLYALVVLLLIQLCIFPNSGFVLGELGIWLLLISVIYLVEKEVITIKAIIFSLSICLSITFSCLLIHKMVGRLSFIGPDWLGGTFGSRNQLVLFCLQAIPLFLYAVLILKNRYLKFWICIVTSLCLTCVILFRCRSGWIIFGFYLFAFLVIQPLRRMLFKKQLRPFFLIISCGTGLFCLAIHSYLSWSTTSPYIKSLYSIFKPSLWSGRVTIWQKSLSLFLENPLLGIGADQLKLRLIDISGNASLSSILTIATNANMNEYLRYLTELGIAGGCFYLLYFFIFPLVLFFRRKHTLRSALFLLSLSAVSIQAFSEHLSQKLISLILFTCILSYLTIQKKNDVVGHYQLIKKSFLFFFVILTLTQMPFRTLALMQITQLSKKPYESFNVYSYWPWTSVRIVEQIHQLIDQGKREEANHLLDNQLKFFQGQESTYESAAIYYSRIGDALNANRLFAQLFQKAYSCSKGFIREVNLFGSFYPLTLETREAIAQYYERCPELPRSANATSLHWEKSQSKLIDWGGKIVFAQTDRLGFFRPKIYYQNKITSLPLLSNEDLSQKHAMIIDQIDNDHLLLLLLSSRKQSYDLMIYDSHSKHLRKINQGQSDTGAVCLKGNILSFNENNERVLVSLSVDLTTRIKSKTLSSAYYDTCTITDGGDFIGFQSIKKDPQLVHCKNIFEDLNCKNSKIQGLETIHSIQNAEGELVQVIGRRPIDEYNRLFSLSLSTSPPLMTMPNLQLNKVDLVALEDDVFRYSSASHYWIEGPSFESDKKVIVYDSKTINGVTYGILSDENHSRSLGFLDNKKWRFLNTHSNLNLPSPLPISLATDVEGDRIPGWLFGDPSLQKLIVWWHGGPSENVSPRYNPYFHLLNNLGYRVLAVNYPGSVGYGKSYERKISKKSLLKTASAVQQYASANAYKKVVSYSVSFGNVIQQIILENDIPFDAIVDQVGNDNGKVKKLAEFKKIPILTVRGQFDPHFRSSEKVSFLYQGGHDIERIFDFEILAWKLSLFLPH